MYLYSLVVKDNFLSMEVLIEGNLLQEGICMYIYMVVGQNVRSGGPQILVHFDINHPF